MQLQASRILVTGAGGFIGKNLLVRLNEIGGVSVSGFERGDDPATLRSLVANADAVIHLAGENRPDDPDAFEETNVGLTKIVCDGIRQSNISDGRHTPIILASSIQVERDNPYGRSKLAAEEAVQALAKETGNPCFVFRLPGVFGKWCRPNYNSVVATFCHNIARGLPIRIDDPEHVIRLAYIDDVLSAFMVALKNPEASFQPRSVSPEYKITVGDLAAQIEAFKNGRQALLAERVGVGLTRALYATYLSHLPTASFSYEIAQHCDERGVFVEMLKTKDSGQFSYFTAHPGVTRGGHYHHTKSEKFLVIKGAAHFRFRHLQTGDVHEIETSGDRPQVVESIPGWVHDVSNIGTEELIVMLWANEIFDLDRPDTVASKVHR